MDERDRDEILSLKHRVATLEKVADDIAKSISAETKARERSNESESSAREETERRISADMADVAEKLGTIVSALMGDISKPDVPGLVQKLTDVRQQQQSNTIALAELKTSINELRKTLDDQQKAHEKYRASMPSPEDLQKLKDATEAQKSRMTYAMGWLGGVSVVIAVIWKVAEFVTSFFHK
jgi:chromosome segregation ATPase